MEGVGTLKYAATERTDIYSLILSYPGNPQEKEVCCNAINFHASFLGMTLMGIHEPHAQPTIPHEHMCWLQSTAGSFYVRLG